MIIWAYWPDCRFLHKKWAKETITSYWVEVKTAELEKVRDYFEDVDSLFKDIRRYRRRELVSDDSFWLLVSKNLESIVVMPWAYAVSNQWGAYCPFRAIGPIDIEDLKDITKLDETSLKPIPIDLLDHILLRPLN